MSDPTKTNYVLKKVKTLFLVPFEQVRDEYNFNCKLHYGCFPENNKTLNQNGKTIELKVSYPGKVRWSLNYRDLSIFTVQLTR